MFEPYLFCKNFSLSNLESNGVYSIVWKIHFYQYSHPYSALGYRANILASRGCFGLALLLSGKYMSQSDCNRNFTF